MAHGSLCQGSVCKDFDPRGELLAGEMSSPEPEPLPEPVLLLLPCSQPSLSLEPSERLGLTLAYSISYIVG